MDFAGWAGYPASVHAPPLAVRFLPTPESEASWRRWCPQHVALFGTAGRMHASNAHVGHVEFPGRPECLHITRGDLGACGTSAEDPT
jgi:hypothetical protein